MLNDMLLGAYCFLLFAFSLLIGYALGFKIISPQTKDDPVSSLFLSTLLGFLFLVTLYSFCITGISSSLLPCFGLILIVSYYGFSLKLPPISHNHAIIGGFFAMWVAYHFLAIQRTLDISFYCLIAKSLEVLPFENYYLTNNYLSDSFRGYSPYHYGEIWADAGLADLFNIPHESALMYVVYPFTSFLAMLGIVSITSLELKLWKRILYCIVLVYLSSSLYHLPLTGFFAGLPLYLFNPSDFIFNKTLFFLPIAVASAWWCQRDKTISILLLCQIPFLSYVTTPAIYAAIPIALVIMYKKNIQTFDETRNQGFVWLGHVCAMCLVRLFNDSPTLPDWSARELFLFYQNNFYLGLISIRNIVCVQSMFIFLSVIPFIPLMVQSYKVLNFRNLYVIIMAMCIGIAGLGSYALLFPLGDSVQLSYVPWSGISFIYIICLLAPLIQLNNLQASLLLVLVILTQYAKTPIKPSSHRYSGTYLQKVATRCEHLSRPKIGSIKKPALLDNYFIYQQPCDPFLSNPKFLGCIPMSRPIAQSIDPIMKFRCLGIIQESAFFEFLYKKYDSMWGLSKKDWENSCCEYIDKYALDGVTAEKGADIPECLRKRSTQIITDSISGETILFF